MKKIVGILSAAAVLAASVFAADVSASAGLSSTLFESDTDGKVVVLGSLANKQTADYATLFSLQYSSDVAGGGVKYWGADDAKTVNFGKFNVWFKPMEGLKLSFLENSLGLFGDKYNGYEAHAVAGVGEGYGVEYSISGLTFNLNFVPEFAGKADRDACAGINEFGLKAAYAADFGSVAVIADFNNGLDKKGKSVNFNSFKVGAGYSGKIADVVDLVGTVGFQYNQKGTNHITDGFKIPGSTLKNKVVYQDRLNLLKATVSAGGNIDAFGWAVCVPATVEFVTFPIKEEVFSYSLPAEFKLGLQVSASYKIGNIGLKAYFESADLFVHDIDNDKSLEETAKANENLNIGDTIKVKEVKNNYFAGNFGVEVTGNVGAASWKVKPDLSINTKKDAEKTTFKISFETGISF